MSTVTTDLLARRAEHARAVAGRRGPVSFLWGDFVTEPGTRVEGAPGRWAPRPDGEPGLHVTASAADGVRIDGRLVDGEGVLAWPGNYSTETYAEFPDGAEGVVFSYDGTTFALQVWHTGSEWARRYAGIAAYDPDPAWAVPATVRRVESGRTVSITHHRDPRPVDLPVVAEVAFERDGIRHRLLAGAHPGDGGLSILFRDATSGDGSYGAGRTLQLADVEGETVLDFNEAGLLPCAFSLAWNCPIPPEENRLPFRVEAGERYAVDHDGKELL